MSIPSISASCTSRFEPRRERRRDAIDPRILFGLWLFATLEDYQRPPHRGADPARHSVYVDLRGRLGEPSSLSDFRVHHGDLLERLLVDDPSRFDAP